MLELGSLGAGQEYDCLARSDFKTCGCRRQDGLGQGAQECCKFGFVRCDSAAEKDSERQAFNRVSSVVPVDAVRPHEGLHIVLRVYQVERDERASRAEVVGLRPASCWSQTKKSATSLGPEHDSTFQGYKIDRTRIRLEYDPLDIRARRSQ